MGFWTVLFALCFLFYWKCIRGQHPNIFDFCKLLLWFRGKPFLQFIADHEEMFAEAKRTGNHAQVTGHFYDVMAELIATYWGDSFHFAAPKYKGQSNQDALHCLHEDIARLSGAAPGKNILDLGCGVGGLMRDVARISGAKMTGITIGDTEVADGNKMNADLGLANQCHIIKGDMQDIPLPPNSMDCIYGVYTLKYLTTLDRCIAEVQRILKPGGTFLVYCIMKTKKYNSENPVHKELYEKFEYSCGMPTMHSIDGVTEVCNRNGLELVTLMDLSHGELQWHNVFTKSYFILWALASPICKKLELLAENIGIFPKGFTKFIEIFVANNFLMIAKGAELGIMSGSEVLIFRKPQA